MLQRLLRPVRRLLQPHQASRKNYRILSLGLGQMESMRRSECVDGEGNIVPWFTYPAIEYLKQLDLSQKRVFEYGSGNSTLFWAARTASVVSVEDDAKWYEKMKPRMPANVTYVLATDRTEYAQAVKQHEGRFDIIVNDGIERYECALACEGKLADGGFIVLDNSEWCAKTAALYRDSDLIEVDMAGFGPINPHTWITSFFFTRSVRLTPLNGVQPKSGVGNWMPSEEELNEWVRG